MSTPLLCLLAFAAWTLSLVVFGIGAIRVGKVLFANERVNAFPADKAHGGPAYRRLLRAHLNCVENLPVFGAVVVIAELIAVHGTLMDRLAVIYVAARLCQTIAHISSGRSLVINVRFSFFLVQLTCVIWMMGLLLGQANASMV